MLRLSLEDFDAHFDRFHTDVFRLETLQRYTVDEEQERIAAFLQGLPRPERSARTSPWLRRIAVTTADGKRWQRVHVVDHPLTDYLRYEIAGYVESAAVGEEIRITDRAKSTELTRLGPDFWLFDEGTTDAFALLMQYDQEGHFIGFEHTADPQHLADCGRQRAIALRHSVSLNTYQAAAKELSKDRMTSDDSLGSHARSRHDARVLMLLDAPRSTTQLVAIQALAG
jgi:hypothetical protein